MGSPASQYSRALKGHRARRQKRLEEREKRDLRVNDLRNRKFSKVRSKFEDRQKRLREEEEKEHRQLQDLWHAEDEEISTKRKVEDEQDLQIYLDGLQQLAEKSTRPPLPESSEPKNLALRPRTLSHDDVFGDDDATDSRQTPSNSLNDQEDMSSSGAVEPMEPASTPTRSIFELRREANMAANKALLGDISPLSVTPKKRVRTDRFRAPRTPTNPRTSFDRTAKNAALTNIRRASIGGSYFEGDEDDEDKDEDEAITSKRQKSVRMETSGIIH